MSGCTKASTIAVVAARSTRVFVFESLPFRSLPSRSTRTLHRNAAVPYSSFPLQHMKAKIGDFLCSESLVIRFSKDSGVKKKYISIALSFVCSRETNKK